LLSLLASQSPDVQHQAVMYLGKFADSPEVLSQLIAYTTANASNPISLAGVYAAVAGIEARFASQFFAGGDWSETAEKSSKFVEGLFSQALSGNPGSSNDYLDLIESTEQTWLKLAILRGLQEGARGEGFERVVLAAPHPLFDDVPADFWGEISKTRQLFTWVGDDLPADAKPLTPSDVARRELGKSYFTKRCAICHGTDGKGIGAIGPPLAGSDWVTGPTERLARIVLHGVKGEIDVLGKRWDSAMPGHSHIEEFDDETAAGLLTHLHRVWGHSGRIIRPDFVTELRTAESERSAQWTEDELMAIDINTHYRGYEGVYGGGAFELRISYDGSGLNIASVYFNGDLEEVTEGEFLFAPRDFQFEFIISDDRVTGIKVPIQGGAVLPRVSDL
jgi:mono/diheme cytochrome c family protein